jgi:hypothetical protein
MHSPVFGKKFVIWNIYCMFNFGWNVSHSKDNTARYYNKCTYVYFFTLRSHWYCKFLWALYSSENVLPNLMKVLPVELKFFWDDGQTDITMLPDTFYNLTNVPKNEWSFTSTPPHTAIYVHTQHSLHISHFIPNTVFHIF